MKDYNFIKSQPVARFYYKGNHTHPVRRTVVIVDITDELLTGYELREGHAVREFKDAPVKSYRRDRIARIIQIDKRRVLRRNSEISSLNRTTLTRQHLKDLIKLGA